MDILNIFVIHLVIHLVTNVNAEVVSSLLGSAVHKDCTRPFLSLYTIGYIQCQKTCIRFSECGVLQYSKSLLECRLYAGTNCGNTPGSAGADIYLNRTKIHEAILGNCQRDGCPASTCVRLRGGGSTCVVDRVMTHYHAFNATFVDIDGAYFGLYSPIINRSNAQLTCETYSGRLAVLDTPRKIRIVTDVIQRHGGLYRLWIGGYRTSGEMKWSTGQPIQLGSSSDHPTAMCALLGTDGILHSNFCICLHEFLCEM